MLTTRMNGDPRGSAELFCNSAPFLQGTITIERGARRESKPGRRAILRLVVGSRSLPHCIRGHSTTSTLLASSPGHASRGSSEATTPDPLLNEEGTKGRSVLHCPQGSVKKSSLPQPAGLFPSSVDLSRRCDFDRFQNQREGLGISRAHDHMPVVGKKDPSAEKKPVLLATGPDHARQNLRVVLRQATLHPKQIARDEEMAVEKHQTPQPRQQACKPQSYKTTLRYPA